MGEGNVSKENKSSGGAAPSDAANGFYDVKRTPKQVIMPAHMMQALSKSIKLEVYERLSKVLGSTLGIFFSLILFVSLFILLLGVIAGKFDGLSLIWVLWVILGSYVIKLVAFQGARIPSLYINAVGVKVVEDSKEHAFLNWEDVMPSSNIYDAHDVSFFLGGRASSPQLIYFDKNGKQRIDFSIHRAASEFNITKNSWQLQRAMLAHLALNASQRLILHREVFIMSQVHPITWKRVKFSNVWYGVRGLLPVFIAFVVSVALAVLVDPINNAVDWPFYVLSIGLVLTNIVYQPYK